MSNAEQLREQMSSSIELLAPENETMRVLELIHGEEIERRLLSLAAYGGTPVPPIPEQEVRFGVSRVALTEVDHQAREEVIKPFMKESGMTIHEHPLGMIGVYKGQDSSLAPLVVMSHTDTVPWADMYDGTLGVLGGITVINAMNRLDIKPQRDIVVAALTGEESSGFGFALFGSKGMFHGLSEEDLAQRRKGGLSIGEALGPDDAQVAKIPIFGPKGSEYTTPYATLELHIEQHHRLDNGGVDLGIVDVIAAPIRHAVEIGDTSLEPDTTHYPNERFIKVHVKGKADHSGATPMGDGRADGLVATSELLLSALENPVVNNGNLCIGPISVDAQAINKIPGPTSTTVRFSGETTMEVNNAIGEFARIAADLNERYGISNSRFDASPFTFEELVEQTPDGFFERDEILKRQTVALGFVQQTNKIASKYGQDEVVGTVGTWTTGQDGKIMLELDVRGVKKEPRDRAFDEIVDAVSELSEIARVDLGKPSAGSGAPPSDMNLTLMNLAEHVLDKYGIGSHMRMHSPAGHDTQQAERTKSIPTFLMFTQSNRGGISHHPDGYTNPENIEKGVKGFAALIMELSMPTKEQERQLINP